MKHLKYILIAFTFSSCGSSLGDLENGLLMKLQTHADSIAYKLGTGLITGIRDSLTGRESQQKLSVMIDSLLTTVGIRTSKDLSMLLDTLAGETMNGRLRGLLKTVQQSIDSIRDDALGHKTGSKLASIIQNDVLGAGTQSRIQHLINDGVLGPQTEQRLDEILARVRDTMIGVTTQSSIDSVVARSLARVQSTANQQQTFLTKNISTILWILGAVLAALLILAAFLFVRKKKTENILKTVTQQIHNIPDQKNYDELTHRISTDATSNGVEQDLRVFLAKNSKPGS